MTDSTKQKILIWLGLVMIATAIIAASLPQLELRPGMPLPRLENSRMVAATAESESFETISANKFVLIFFVILMAGLGLYVLYKVLRGAEWKNLTGIIWSTLIISLIVSGFIYLILRFSKFESSMAMELPVPTPEPLVTSSLGTPPPLLVWLVGVGLLVTGSLIAIWIFTLSPGRATTIDVVGLEAEKAWQKLKTGLGLKDVIMKCYGQMSLALAQEQGIERKDFMTTREFENFLEATGVPHDPVHQLTQLFEAVRYGNWQPNPIDEEKAIHCLEAIMLYSRQAKGTN